MNNRRLEELISELQTGNARQRRAASYKLSNSKSPMVVSALIHAYDDVDGSVRQNVIDGLRKIKSKEAIDFLNLMGKGIDSINYKEAATSMNTVEPPTKTSPLQLALYLVMAVTLILGIWLRLIHVGWFLVFLFIPLLWVAGAHLMTQVRAIRRVPKMKPSYIYLILFSNLFFFLGFALQADFGDTVETSYSGANIISIPSFVALIVSWIFLSGKLFLNLNNEIQVVSVLSPTEEFSKKIRSQVNEELPTFEISTALSIPNSEDMIVMMKYVTTFRNVFRCKPNGSIQWQAELPTEAGDVYTNIEWKGGHLTAYSRSCISVVLDTETGKILLPKTGV